MIDGLVARCDTDGTRPLSRRIARASRLAPMRSVKRPPNKLARFYAATTDTGAHGGSPHPQQSSLRSFWSRGRSCRQLLVYARQPPESARGSSTRSQRHPHVETTTDGSGDVGTKAPVVSTRCHGNTAGRHHDLVDVPLRDRRQCRRWRAAAGVSPRRAQADGRFNVSTKQRNDAILIRPATALRASARARAHDRARLTRRDSPCYEEVIAAEESTRRGTHAPATALGSRPHAEHLHSNGRRTRVGPYFSPCSARSRRSSTRRSPCHGHGMRQDGHGSSRGPTTTVLVKLLEIPRPLLTPLLREVEDVNPPARLAPVNWLEISKLTASSRQQALPALPNHRLTAASIREVLSGSRVR